MDLAIAVADLAVSRSGSATVSELTAAGVPAVFVPYPVGNGEQRFNAADVVAAVEQDEVAAAAALEVGRHREAGEPCADDGDVDVLRWEAHGYGSVTYGGVG